MCFSKSQLTSEHVLALSVKDAGARLQVLALEEIGKRDGDRIRGPRLNRLGLAGDRSRGALGRTRCLRAALSTLLSSLLTGLLTRLLTRLLSLLALLSLLSLLLLLLLLHALHLLHALPLQLLNELRHGHTMFLGFGCELLLHGLDLLRGWHLHARGHALGRDRHRHATAVWILHGEGMNRHTMQVDEKATPSVDRRSMESRDGTK